MIIKNKDGEVLISIPDEEVVENSHYNEDSYYRLCLLAGKKYDEVARQFGGNSLEIGFIDERSPVCLVLDAEEEVVERLEACFENFLGNRTIFPLT